MVYQCVAKIVMETPFAKNFAIVIGANKQFSSNYLLNFPSNGELHHLVDSSLDVDINKFNTLTFPNCCNFVSGSKQFVCSG